MWKIFKRTNLEILTKSNIIFSNHKKSLFLYKWPESFTSIYEEKYWRTQEVHKLIFESLLIYNHQEL